MDNVEFLLIMWVILLVTIYKVKKRKMIPLFSVGKLVVRLITLLVTWDFC